MLDTHEKVKNALSNGAMETLADQEVEVVGAAPTPYVPLIGDDNNVRFGPVPPPNPQPRNYMPTFGRKQPRDESSSDEDSPSKKPAPSKKQLKCVLCCPHPCVHTLTLVIVQDCERFEQGGAQEEDASQA
jgi:hypothetical protein